MLSLSPSNASSATASLSKVNRPGGAGLKFGEAAPVKLSKEITDMCDSLSKELVQAVRPELRNYAIQHLKVEQEKKRLSELMQKLDKLFVQAMENFDKKIPDAIKLKRVSAEEGKQIAEYSLQSVFKSLREATAQEMKKPPTAKL